MFRAYWMGPKYGIGHIIERFEANLRVARRKAGGWGAFRVDVDCFEDGKPAISDYSRSGTQLRLFGNRLR